MKKILLITIVTFFAISTFCVADTIHVPGDQPTIQAGIDVASRGDTVLVAPGTYIENIDFLGKAIIVMSSGGAETTVIDGGNPLDPNIGSVVTFKNNEDADSLLEGFTLTNGYGTVYEWTPGLWKSDGGAIYCYDSSPSIMNNSIQYNGADYGAGIACKYFASPTIMYNTIKENKASITTMTSGGGILCEDNSSPIITNNAILENAALSGGGIDCNYYSSPSISNNIFMGNWSRWGGGGISCFKSSPIIQGNIISGSSTERDGGGLRISGESFPSLINNTIVGNIADEEGGGISCNDASAPALVNNIVWNNAGLFGSQISIGYYGDPASLSLSYSDVKGGVADVAVDNGCTLHWGNGMIETDPLFVDANGDYHLTFLSPCKDIGDNSAVTEQYDFEGDPRIAYGTLDMGADEFHPHLYCTGDFTPNGSIDGKFLGLPDTWPVGLFLGSGVIDPPLQHTWGEFYLEAPWMAIPLVPIPANGVLVIPETLPPTPAPYDIPMQALIGWELSNLFVIEVR